ncbi:MAG: S-layer homology domain-containing protein [Ruminococcaceae bacterium]|nr:S-layer homology domain-containing protein [Oscillospiraceae bacterium]
MKKFKLMSLVLAMVMVLSTFTMSFASTFADVTESYAWASEAIESMASEKIILGYEDGTFRPEKTVSKLESLVLAARVLGVNDDANEDFISTVYDKFGLDVESYELPFGENEIVYLLANGTLLEKELSDYIGSSNVNQGLKRYELAVILTKAMGAEEKVKQNLVSVLDYSDESEIPSYAKKYVEYVTEQGLMQGVSENEFSPNTTVTRAQMAVVLYKLKALAGFERFSAIVSSVDPLIGVLRFKDKNGEQYGYTIKDETSLRFEGEKISADDIVVGYEGVITTKNGSLFSVDFITPDVEESFKASISSIAKSAKLGTVIKFNKFLENTETESVEFPVSDTVVVNFDGEPSSVSALKTGDYAEVTVKKGKVTILNAKQKTEIVKGVVEDVTIGTNGVVLTVLNTDDRIVECIAGNTVSVNKNSKTTATLADIVAGDSVSITLEYGYITKVIATSKTSNSTGFVEEIHITDNPKVVIKLNGESKEYALANSVEIFVNGVKGSIYDLRLATSAKLTLESDTITKIETSPVETVTQISGTVDLVNAAYGLIQVTYFDEAMAQKITQSVFVGKNTKIMNNSTGKEASLKTIAAGSHITVIGSISSGVFEATTVIVIG